MPTTTMAPLEPTSRWTSRRKPTPAANFAGSINFVTIRPSGGTGTFDLTPTHTTVRPGASTKLALEWTVPSGGWRVLKDVELRLKDDDGRTILRIRFNEASNTFQI